VTVPLSFLKTAGSLASVCMVVCGLGCSSSLTSTSFPLTLILTLAISDVNLPSLLAAAHVICERRANSSHCARVRPWEVARFSAVTPACGTFEFNFLNSGM
jgi:hypothetical protein